MASGSYAQSNVKCPYYTSDNGRDRIICEGIVPNSKLSSFFKKRSEYEMQMNIFCCDKYYFCEICAALDKKYEDD